MGLRFRWDVRSRSHQRRDCGRRDDPDNGTARRRCRGARPHAGDLVILPRASYAKWIDPGSRYRDLLEPDADTLELVPVSTAVNSVKNDGPECTEGVALPS